ncbi:MAG: ATP-binding protein [Candidatus Hermodarchaeota archaeon]
MESKIDVYRELQQHLDELPIGFPGTNSGVEIRLLKNLFTPKEAKIASLLKFSWNNLESLESIFKRLESLGYTIKELEKHLDNMAKKGSIKFLKEGNKKFYGNAMLIIGMFENQVNKLTKEFIDNTHKYMKEAWFKDLVKVSISQWRTIPIGINFNHNVSIANYDDIEKLINTYEEPIAIINCVCRQAQDLLNNACKVTLRRELCLGFGQTAQVYIEMGWARQISKKEAFNYLQKNQEEGLILQVSNAQNPEIICSCCSCCCEGLSNLKKLPNPADFVISNYHAKIDLKKCSGCETCKNRCQMKAIEIKNDSYFINLRRCIGCGNCVITCPSDAIKLHRKEKLNIPPNTHEDLYKKISKLKIKVKERELKRKSRIERRVKN